MAATVGVQDAKSYGQRLHSELRHRTPVEFEAAHYRPPGTLVLMADGFVVGIPLAFLVLAFRVKARATPDVLVVRSYLKTYVIPFDDVLTFNNAAYSGLWNRSADTSTWLNFGLRMVDVVRAEGVGIPLRATMCRRRTCERIVEQLNTRQVLLRSAGIALKERPDHE